MSGKLLNDNVEDIPNTPYQLYKNTENAFEEIDRCLFEFNKRRVPPTQSPEVIDIHYIVKRQEDIIAGIHADVYIWNILHINVFFVDEQYRNKGLGSFLLKKVECDAERLGVKLAHLDTFEFQAKNFYLKAGYEIFGVLDGCPDGYQRYYMKKSLS